MSFSKSLGVVALCLLVIFLGGFGGCYAGSQVGHGIDVRNGTFGTGMEGSPYEIGLMMLGWVVGMLLAGVAISVVLRRKRP